MLRRQDSSFDECIAIFLGEKLYMKFRFTDLSSDSGTPWFVCHLIAQKPRANGNSIEWTGYGTSLLQAKVASIAKMLFTKSDKE